MIHTLLYLSLSLSLCDKVGRRGLTIAHFDADCDVSCGFTSKMGHISLVEHLYKPY